MPHKMALWGDWPSWMQKRAPGPLSVLLTVTVCLMPFALLGSEATDRVAICLWGWKQETGKPDPAPGLLFHPEVRAQAASSSTQSASSCVLSGATPCPSWSSCPHCFQRPDPCFSVLNFAEAELPLKKDGFTSESTTLEALLRGEGVEKKVDAREEESMQEIQVFLRPPWGGGGGGGGRVRAWARGFPEALAGGGSCSQTSRCTAAGSLTPAFLPHNPASRTSPHPSLGVPMWPFRIYFSSLLYARAGLGPGDMMVSKTDGSPHPVERAVQNSGLKPWGHLHQLVPHEPLPSSHPVLIPCPQL